MSDNWIVNEIRKMGRELHHDAGAAVSVYLQARSRGFAPDIRMKTPKTLAAAAHWLASCNLPGDQRPSRQEFVTLAAASGSAVSKQERRLLDSLGFTRDDWKRIVPTEVLVMVTSTAPISGTADCPTVEEIHSAIALWYSEDLYSQEWWEGLDEVEKDAYLQATAAGEGISPPGSWEETVSRIRMGLAGREVQEEFLNSVQTYANQVVGAIEHSLKGSGHLDPDQPWPHRLVVQLYVNDEEVC